MKLINNHTYAESVKLIKNEILNFIRLKYDDKYEYYTTGELMDMYIPSDNLSLWELEEVCNYLEHYGWEEDHYDGILADWNGFEIVRKEIDAKSPFDEDCTYRANDGLKDCGPVSDEWKGEVLQVVTDYMHSFEGEDEDLADFYERCRVLANNIIKKYEYTDCSVLGVSLWEVAEQYCLIYKDMHIVRL